MIEPCWEYLSGHCSIIWPVWLSRWVITYDLSGCGFEPHCSHLKNSNNFWSIVRGWYIFAISRPTKKTSRFLSGFLPTWLAHLAIKVLPTFQSWEKLLTTKVKETWNETFFISRLFIERKTNEKPNPTLRICIFRNCYSLHYNDEKLIKKKMFDKGRPKRRLLATWTVDF